MLDALSEVLWRVPGKFNLASLLGPRYSLRCVLFHDISDRPSPFTAGMRVSMRRNEFEARIHFLAQNYTPIDLETFLDGAQGGKLPLEGSPQDLSVGREYKAVMRNMRADMKVRREIKKGLIRRHVASQVSRAKAI